MQGRENGIAQVTDVVAGKAVRVRPRGGYQNLYRKVLEAANPEKRPK